MIMKQTIKYFGLIAAAAAIAFSCTKETDLDIATPETQTEQQSQPVVPATDGNLLTSFGVTIEGQPQDPETKVSVDLGEGTTAIEENDEVLVFVGASNYAIYKYNGTEFVLKEGETAVALDNPASVFYPASEYVVDGSDVLFVMPNGIETSGEDLGAINPMAGQITGSADAYTVQLCNLASVLRVMVTADVNIKSVELDFGSKDIAHGSKYTIDADTKEMEFASGSTSETETVSLETPAKSADVLFLIPTVELNGLTVTANLAEEHNGGTNTFSVSNASTTARTRNTIATMSFYAGLFSGGEGTSESPYLIANARDFKYIQKYTTAGYGDIPASSFLAAHYQQTADIDFNGATLTPIGTESAPFSGVYKGGAKGLDNFKVSVDDFAGLFGVISGGAVENITIGNKASISTTVDGKGAGSIAGKLIAGTISGCTNSAPVECTKTSGNSYVGGIVGLVYNTTGNVNISECVNNGAIKCNIFAGGIAGSINAGSNEATVFKCINNAAVTANGSNAGGIAGALYKGTINLCYGGTATQSNNYPTGGAIVKTVSRAGGIVGIMNNTDAWVINCSSRAFVWTTGGNSDNYKAAAGGLVGYINTGGGHIVNSVHWNMNVTNTGVSEAADAKGKIAVGGIVGYIANTTGSVANCYTQRQGNALGCYKVSGSTMSALCMANNSIGTWIGQIYGYNKGTVINSYYSTAYTGLGTNAGTSKITGVANGVKNGTEAQSNVQIYDLSGDAYGLPVTGKLWEILEAGKNLTGWTGSDDMSWTHYTSGSLEVTIPTVILNAGEDFYL